MKLLITILILATVLIAGCLGPQIHSTPVPTKNETKQETIYEKLSGNDLRIWNVEWGTGQCKEIKGYTLANCREGSFPKYANDKCVVTMGYAIVYALCKRDNLYCEVYVNERKSNLANGLQKCGDEEIIIAEKESNEKSFYTDLQEDKNIKLCCSYLDNGKYLKDYEICVSTILEAYCYL